MEAQWQAILSNPISNDQADEAGAAHSKRWYGNTRSLFTRLRTLFCAIITMPKR